VSDDHHRIRRCQPLIFRALLLLQVRGEDGLCDLRGHGEGGGRKRSRASESGGCRCGCRGGLGRRSQDWGLNGQKRFNPQCGAAGLLIRLLVRVRLMREREWWNDGGDDWTMEGRRGLGGLLSAGVNKVEQWRGGRVAMAGFGC
jgi:hypothetical protein